jgi:uncharacterized membrane protein YjjP (DUF1212 family)
MQMSMSKIIILLTLFNVTLTFRISASIIVSFIARVLSTLPRGYFCYNAIASAGITLILPGFTVCVWSPPYDSISILILLCSDIFP